MNDSTTHANARARFGADVLRIMEDEKTTWAQYVDTVGDEEGA